MSYVAATGRVDRDAQAAWVLGELRRLGERGPAAGHPLLRAWAAGTLSDAALQEFAAEHHHVPVALADVTARAAALSDGLLHHQLRRQAGERERELDAWFQFARATGWSAWSGWHYAADPLPETERALRVWRGDARRPLAEHLVTIHALETAQLPTARAALGARHGSAGGAPARYFELRVRGESGPAGLMAAALTGLLPVADPAGLLAHAERVQAAYRGLLDGVAGRVGAAAQAGHRPEITTSTASD